MLSFTDNVEVARISISCTSKFKIESLWPRRWLHVSYITQLFLTIQYELRDCRHYTPGNTIVIHLHGQITIHWCLWDWFVKWHMEVCSLLLETLVVSIFNGYLSTWGWLQDGCHSIIHWKLLDKIQTSGQLYPAFIQPDPLMLEQTLS